MLRCTRKRRANYRQAFFPSPGRENEKEAINPPAGFHYQNEFFLFFPVSKNSPAASCRNRSSKQESSES